MIFRLSQKLSTKFKSKTLASLPLDDNLLADWSAHLFVADRTQYILLCHTKSLYSTVTYARGITDANRFIQRAMTSLREFMEEDRLAFIYDQFIAPASATVRFAKALDRSVTGSINDLVNHARFWLTEGSLSPFDTGFKLNEIPFSSLRYVKSREAFKRLADKTG